MLSLRRASSPALLGLAVLAPLLLTGCEKPSPGITVFAGSTSQRAEAACWAQDADGSVQQPACAGESTEIEVGTGDTLGISVDKNVAESGWRIRINDEEVTPETIEDTYYKVPVASGLGGQEFKMQIFALSESGQEIRGAWNFTLVPRT